MKVFISLITLFILQSTIHAQVKLTSLNYENGFKYPHAEFPSDKTIEDKLNAAIISSIEDLKASEYCIGEFGYVQKGSHIEIHMICNCIDLAQAEHRYILLNTKTGEKVTHSDLFSDKEQKNALAFIQKKVNGFESTIEVCGTAFDALKEPISFNDINIRLYRDGIEVRPAGTNDCELTTLRLTWDELKPFLHYNFI